MGQRDDDGGRAVEQEFERLLDQPDDLEPGIDDAVETKDDFPREDPQQIAGPERQGHQDDPEQLALVHVKGHVVGHRIGNHHGGDGAGARDPKRTHKQRFVYRAFEGLAVIAERE